MSEYEKSNGFVTDSALHKWIEDNDLEITKDITEALYIMRDGTMISGTDAETGIRGLDHMCAQDIISEGETKNLYGSGNGVENFWKALHAKTGLIRYVPETKVALIGEHQNLTDSQNKVLNQENNYKIEPYVPLAPEKNWLNNNGQKNSVSYQKEKIKNIISSIKHINKATQLSITDIEPGIYDSSHIDYTIWENDNAAKEHNGAFVTSTIDSKAINATTSKEIQKEVLITILNQQKSVSQDAYFAENLRKIAANNVSQLQKLNAYDIVPSTKQKSNSIEDQLNRVYARKFLKENHFELNKKNIQQISQNIAQNRINSKKQHKDSSVEAAYKIEKEKLTNPRTRSNYHKKYQKSSKTNNRQNEGSPLIQIIQNNDLSR